jgi:hypothetical protein
MEQWDRDYIDLDGPGFIKFERGGSGAMRFGAVEADLDCTSDPGASEERIEFSFEGHNDADSCSERGCTAGLRGSAIRPALSLSEAAWCLTTRSKTGGRKRRFARLLPPFNAGVRLSGHTGCRSPSSTV